MSDKTYSIGEISRMYNIGLDSIRYYEEIGLIHPKRKANNYRYYGGDDIFRLNVIRELLDLGFSSKEIQNYFENRNIKKTYELLKKEQVKIVNQQKRLRALKRNVDQRIDEIKKINKIKFDTIYTQKYAKRNFFIINESYNEDEDMNILIQKLGKKDQSDFYIIGNNHIGTRIPIDDFLVNNKPNYQGVFAFDKKGNCSLEGGDYLRIFYNGGYEKTIDCINKLNLYIKENKLLAKSDYLEIIWSDIHVTDYEKEYVTELQIRVGKDEINSR